MGKKKGKNNKANDTAKVDPDDLATAVT